VKPSKELIGASTRLLVLGALAREPSYGYKIVREVNESTGDIFTCSQGTIYPILVKLGKEKLLRAQWQGADKGHWRKYYYITAKGRAALEGNVADWNRFHGLISRLTEVQRA
jgi:DNA-binding PadR family transcriptional regulator